MNNPILGLQEIAPLLEVDKRTPHAWQYRKLLPTADYASINGLRAWNRQTIIKWAAETGRLPEALKAESTVEPVIPRGGRKAKAASTVSMNDTAKVTA